MSNQIIIIARTSTQPIITPRLAVGPQGVSGPELKIQYSYDAESWHGEPVETDRYIRFSTDDGISWGQPLLISNLAGYVVGPDSSTDGGVVVFDGITGKVIKDSGELLSDYVSKAGGTMSGILTAPEYRINDNTYFTATEGKINNNTVWHAGNDGSGSGLDADLLDGKHLSEIGGGEKWEVFPIGVPIQVWDHLSSSVVPPNSGDVIYVRLTAGQSALGGYNYGNLSSESVTGSAPLVVATAVISLSTSPLYNKTIHLINTEQAVIRARTTSGTQQNDAFQGHRHFNTTYDLIRYALSADQTRDVGSADNNATTISQNDGTTAGAYGTPRLANETRPKNVSATFYLRIK